MLGVHTIFLGWCMTWQMEEFFHAKEGFWSSSSPSVNLTCQTEGGRDPGLTPRVAGVRRRRRHLLFGHQVVHVGVHQGLGGAGHPALHLLGHLDLGLALSRLHVLLPLPLLAHHPPHLRVHLVADLRVLRLRVKLVSAKDEEN